jgi:hypothetical protein
VKGGSTTSIEVDTIEVETRHLYPALASTPARSPQPTQEAGTELWQAVPRSGPTIGLIATITPGEAFAGVLEELLGHERARRRRRDDRAEGPDETMAPKAGVRKTLLRRAKHPVNRSRCRHRRVQLTASQHCLNSHFDPERSSQTKGVGDGSRSWQCCCR